jgi:intein/homing endonuclease
MTNLDNLSRKELYKLKKNFAIARKECEEDYIYFINSFCYTFNPKEEPFHFRFKLFPFQKRLCHSIYNSIMNKEDLFVEKCREIGVTYVGMAMFLWFWLFQPASNFLIGSRKEDYVDNRRGGTTGNKEESLFGKIDYMLSRLPTFLLPKGFDVEKHFNYMSLVNPELGNVISGESANPNFSRGSRHRCLVGETLINTSEGIINIKNAMKKGIDKVMDDTGVFRKVRAYIKVLPEELIKLKTKFGYEIIGTKDHPVVTNNGLKKLSEIKLNDKIKIVSYPIFPDKKIISKELAMIFGLLVSEGDVNKKSHIGFSNKDYWLIKKYITLFKREFNTDLTGFIRKLERNYPNGDYNYCFYVNRSMMKIRKKMFKMGLTREKSKKKSIPKSVLMSDKEIQTAFLKGIFEGDGSVSKPKSLNNRLNVTYTTISKRLARELQVMLLSFGILSSIRSDLRINRKNRIYTLRMGGYYAKKFCDEIGFLSKRKNSVSNGYYSSNIIPHNSHYRLNSNGWLLPILKKEKYKKEITYDIELEKNHFFVTNGIISHNSIFLDEFAFWDHGMACWGATADTTNCRIVVTTPGIKPSKAKRLRFGKDGEKIKILTLTHKLDPRKTRKWLEEQKKRRSKEDFNREIMIDWEGSTVGRVYPEIESAKLGDYPLIPHEQLYCSWDFGLDGTAICFWQYNKKTNRWRLIDCYENNNQPIQFYFPLFDKPIDSKFQYDDEDLKAIREISKLPKAIHFGDPDVKKTSILTGTSTRNELSNVGIYVQCQQKNDFYSRREKTKVALQNGIEINKNERTEYALECIKNARYPARDEDSSATTPIAKPIHDYTSHFRTSWEYLFVNVDDFLEEPENPDWYTNKKWSVKKHQYR